MTRPPFPSPAAAPVPGPGTNPTRPAVRRWLRASPWLYAAGLLAAYGVWAYKDWRAANAAAGPGASVPRTAYGLAGIVLSIFLAVLVLVAGRKRGWRPANPADAAGHAGDCSYISCCRYGP